MRRRSVSSTSPTASPSSTPRAVLRLLGRQLPQPWHRHRGGRPRRRYRPAAGCPRGRRRHVGADRAGNGCSPAVGLVGGATRAFTSPTRTTNCLAPGERPSMGVTSSPRLLRISPTGCPSPSSARRSTPPRCCRACCRSRFESGEHGQELVCEVLWVDHYGNCHSMSIRSSCCRSPTRPAAR